jgi:hypothetical protein
VGLFLGRFVSILKKLRGNCSNFDEVAEEVMLEGSWKRRLAGSDIYILLDLYGLIPSHLQSILPITSLASSNADS